MTQRGRAGAGSKPGGRRPGGPRRESAAPPGAAAAPRIDLVAARGRVRAVIEPVITAAGYDLEEFTLSRAGRRHLVRVMVDRDGGVDLDAVAVVSRDISAALDAAEEAGGELLVGEYQLEVGSPGVDRPLTLPRHWRRNVSRLVAVTVGGQAVTGRVTAADDAGVLLDVDGRVHELSYAQLGPGRVQIEFNRVAEADLDESGLDDGDLDGFADDTDFDDDDDDDEVGEGEER